MFTSEFSISNVVRSLARFLYIIDPSTTYEKIEDIPKPDFVDQAIPYFLTLIIIEYIVQCIKDKPRTRLNDGITSLAGGFFMVLKDLLFRGCSGFSYIYIYENFRVLNLPWDSPYTWYAAAILGDLCYYWAHRAAHEINVLWALHQVHHSSEDYNLTTALRQSGFQSTFTWFFFLPTAFFIPPSLFLIHQQFNLLYQFWIHTEVIDTLGPLEYVFNTPRHHRVHHGSNRYCLDKNYAGVLIIWDRMFGTFQEELPGPITYGLVEDLNSFNPLWLQFFHYGKIWKKAETCESTTDKLSAALKGPGWFPGMPRLGDPSGVAEFPNRPRYDPKIPSWQNVYVFLHFVLTVGMLEILTRYQTELCQTNVILFVASIIYTLTSIGFLLDGKKIGILTEIVRCLVAVVVLYKNANLPVLADHGKTVPCFMGFYGISLLTFLIFGFTQLARPLFYTVSKKLN